MSTELITASEESQRFELAQRKAKMYSSSTLVPKEYQGNVANCMIAMEMAARLGVNDLMAMQNVNIIHGRPSFSSQFLISCFNSCGRFTAIKYRMNKERTSCVAYATELATGEIVEGTEVTLEMAKAEGWTSKNGSKWKTMPEHMLRWRAASFLVRQVAPEVGMGFHTTEELRDIQPTIQPRASDLIARIEGKAVEPPEQPETDAETEPPYQTWEDTIAAQTKAEGVYSVLEQIDDEVAEGPFRDSLVTLANERIAELKG